MDEAFMDMPTHCEQLHPQSLLMELNWVCGWFQRILKIKQSDDAPQILICDRSPLSAVFYTSNNNGLLLAPVIQAQIAELKQAAKIDIYTVHVKCDEDVLWNRIQQRLAVEPERAMYKEDSFAWMQEVKHFYDNFPSWDFQVENNGQNIATLKQVIGEVLLQMRAKHPILREANLKLDRHLLVHSAPPKRALLSLTKSE